MCLIVFAYKVIPGTPLLLAGNRDEFYNRPTDPAAKWNTDPVLIAGKDKKAGGTWLGITENGRYAAITNFRDMQNVKENAPSRGHIVKNALLHDVDILKYLKHLKTRSKEFNGFNLFAGTKDNLYYLNNIQNNIEKLKPGFYVISNAFLNTPWPKASRAKDIFKKLVTNKPFDRELIFELLLNNETYSIEKLPNTGLSDEMEKAVSAIFIQTEHYGTRCSTMLQINDNNTFFFEERTFEPGTRKISVKKVFDGRFH